MTLTRHFTETIKSRADRDPEYRAAMLSEAVELLVTGDLVTGKLILRDYINATIGFSALGQRLGKNSKVLMRMLSVGGNPTAANIFSILAKLQEEEGVTLTIRHQQTAMANAGQRQASTAA